MLPSALVVTLLASTWAAPYPEQVGPPESMTALGDSITRANNTSFQATGDHPERSWATGTDADAGVVSHYTQLDALGDAPLVYNDAVSGARMEGIGPQVTDAIANGAEYVTILMGGNDACRSNTDRTPNMTDPAVYRQQFEDAMEALTGGLPDSRIFVASVPDVYILWEVLHTNANAVQVWDAARICQSLLYNPESTDPADVARRQAVRDRVVEYNVILEDVCDQYIHCRFDENKVFDTAFTAADVSTVDYFHPSLQGQIRLGTETWASTFDFTDLTAPVTTLAAVVAGTDATLTLTATDPEGVRGIEYRAPGDTRWTRYDAPITVSTSSFVFFRAVDVNGNIEDAQRYPPPEGDGGAVEWTPDGGSDAGEGTDAGDPPQGQDGGEDGGDPAQDGDGEGAPRGCGCGSNGALPVTTLGLALAAMAAMAARRRRQK